MTGKPQISQSDMRIIDEVFEMGGGYVLDFSDRTFSTFFLDEIGVNIDQAQYSEQGGSKAKRLRHFLRLSDRALCLKTLEALWSYRSTIKLLADDPDMLSSEIILAYGLIVKRLGGTPPGSDTPINSVAESSTISSGVVARLSGDLIKVGKLAPHPRGYAFERFLKDFFDEYGLSGRDAFRLRGEQIDGSFVHIGQTYLLEAKWTNSKVDAATLRAFNAKIEDKAAWSRGLLVSYSGFTEEGLSAFGKGSSLICMDGLDLYETLSRALNFPEVISAKVRRAAEAGQPFVPVRELNLVSKAQAINV